MQGIFSRGQNQTVKPDHQQKKMLQRIHQLESVAE